VARVLLTGASGMLGKQVFDKLISHEGYEVYTVSRKLFVISKNHFVKDIGDNSQLKQVLNDCQPEIVINCAAYVNLDFCEKEHAATDMLHQHAVKTLSSYSSVQALYYISTDSVFDGQRGNYTEADHVSPLNYYAQSKVNGEMEALKNARNAYVIRTNILGFNSISGKSLFEWAYQNLSAGNNINGFSNVYFNPLYVGDLADMLVSFIGMSCDPGIYNFASQPVVSKYDVVKKIARAFEFNEELIKPAILNNSHLETLRPLNTTLNTDKINRLGIEVPQIDTCIHHLLNDFLKYGIRI
jgi:dTDP-4-dehydrorhamnose reductase